MTLEALEDVKTNQVIDHSKVQAWADSLGTANQSPQNPLLATLEIPHP